MHTPLIFSHAENTIIELGLKCFCVALLISIGSHALNEEFNFDRNAEVSNQTSTVYSDGVRVGIINPEKYSLERDEKKFIKDEYRKFTLLNGSQPINYQDWLVKNNYGSLADAQESIFLRKKKKPVTPGGKKAFMKTVKKGDILISFEINKGKMGHAAIMASDAWALEMPGGNGYVTGIESNNRKVRRNRWFIEHYAYSTTVYRNRNNSVALEAADWANRMYYNPDGGTNKTIHVTYRLFPSNFQSINPSYCSKLVLQAFYYGVTPKNVIRDPKNFLVFPVSIPRYFLPPYTLVKLGTFIDDNI